MPGEGRGRRVWASLWDEWWWGWGDLCVMGESLRCLGLCVLGWGSGGLFVCVPGSGHLLGMGGPLCMCVGGIWAYVCVCVGSKP